MPGIYAEDGLEPVPAEQAAPAEPAGVDNSKDPTQEHEGEGDEGHPSEERPEGEHGKAKVQKPGFLAMMPFITILLGIAILPLIHATEHIWHKNQVKLAVSAAMAIITLIYYFSRGYGVPFHEHLTHGGVETVKAILIHSVLDEYIPFIVLLFSLFTISGGIRLTGDLHASPATNTIILGIGAGIASFVGTTGASMLLIRPLLQTNRQRKHVTHTIVFFIFLVSNIGGSLLPIGDPPLFLGYLYGVPFTWTLKLFVPWAFVVCLLLIVYFIWDTRMVKKETVEAMRRNDVQVQPLRLRGALNFLWLGGVILAVAFLVPGKAFAGISVKPFMREGMQLLLVAIAWLTTRAELRKDNQFSFFAIAEVAALFIGIFITMQVPIEYLRASSADLSGIVNSPVKFFWFTGILSSLLDNAPTYAVFFSLGSSMTDASMAGSQVALAGGGSILESWLVAISLGAVFMGANTYIGNGPNFMVKSIAESSGRKMPSFFGYMVYSIGILIPTFVIVTLLGGIFFNV
ncbi:MAG: sodium:proton antiporter [Planctomycetota bacterium]|nr:sodium:proton antiporter [Planctomycetota bacterium]MDA1141635.1 sodium:proton antiporter [Planctomycetota bacterium]